MNRKVLGIIILIIIIAAAFIVFNSTKEDVFREVHGEKISNSSNIFVVTTIKNSNGNLVDTNFGKVNVELLDKNSDCGVMILDCPVEHGKSIYVDHNGAYRFKAHYDGGYFYNPADASGDLVILNETNLTYDNITKSF